MDNAYKGFSFIVCLTIVTLILIATFRLHTACLLQVIVSIYWVKLFVSLWLLVICVSQTSLMVGGFRSKALWPFSSSLNANKLLWIETHQPWARIVIHQSLTNMLIQIVCIRLVPPGLQITAGQRTMSGLIADLTGQTPVLPVILTGHFWTQTLYFPYSCRLMLYNAAMISFFFGVFCCFALNPSKKRTPQ